MLDQYKFDAMTFTWLDGGRMLSDGGTSFGPVPRALWGRYYPFNRDGLIPQVADPILVQYQDKNYLIEAGMNQEKLSPKEYGHFGFQDPPRVLESLAACGLDPEDIHGVLMTHMHNDHANGLTLPEGEGFRPTFPNATIYMTDIEWQEVRHPHKRTRNTYLQANWEAIQDQVVTFDGSLDIVQGIRMEHTGGHSRGHAMIQFQQGEETVFHLGDIHLTCVHTNPLWVGGMDDYPMDTIQAKEKYLGEALAGGYPILFYHDPFFRMLRYTPDGKGYVEALRPNKASLLMPGACQDKWLQAQD